jgi:hypothetical protein
MRVVITFEYEVDERYRQPQGSKDEYDFLDGETEALAYELRHSPMSNGFDILNIEIKD